MGLFDHLKKHESHSYKKYKYRYLIVGSDFSAVGMYHFLQGLYGPQEVKMIDNKDLTSDLLFFPGPGVVRGEANAKIVSLLRPDLTCEKRPISLFYKDQKFRRFNGRSKPYEMKRTEPLFVQENHFVDLEKIDLGLDPINEREGFKKIEFRKIKRLEEDEFKGWVVESEDDEQYLAENLIFCRPASEFVRLYEDSNFFDESFLKYANSTQVQKALVLEFKIPEDILERDNTLFLAQSLTHEWGHFIVETHPASRETLKCFTNLEDEDVSEEEISKKIKLLKKVIARIFPKFSEVEYDENIWVIDYTPFLSIDDNSYDESFLSDLSGLRFLGPFAAIDQSYFDENELEIQREKVSDVARTLLSLHQLQRRLS